MKRLIAAVVACAVAAAPLPAAAASAVRAAIAPRVAGPTVLPVLPATLSLTPHALSAPSLAPSVALTAPVLSAPVPLVSAPAASLAAPSAAPTPLARSLEALAAPSDIGALPANAGSESSGRAAETDFNKRLGVDSPAAASLSAAAEAPSPESRPLASFTAATPRENRTVEQAPPRAERENRSALFPLVLAGLAGAAWLAVQAARWGVGSAFHAASGEPVTALTVLGVTAAAALVVSGAFVLNTVVEMAAFGLVVWRGRGVTDEQFRARVRAEVLEGRLDPNAAAMVKPYRPDGRGTDFTFAFVSRGSIWVRPELAAFPWLLRTTLVHELSHVKAHGPRGPPRGGVRGLLSHLYSEVRARAAELRGPGALRKIKVPALERALRQGQMSMRFARPYDVLVLNPSAPDLRDPKLYANLSDGTARVVALDTPEPQKALGEGEARRFQAVVMGGAAALLPAAKSPDALRLDAALKQLDSLSILATRLIARGSAFPGAAADSAEAKGWSDLVGKAERLRRDGSRKGQLAFEKDVRQFWQQIAATRLKGLAATGLIENLYRGLRDHGVAFMTFGPTDPGVATWERLLRYWEGEDGGQLKVTRVDLEDGGHVLLLRKVETRVGLWLRPIAGGRIATSVANAWQTDEGRAAALASLEAAGFGKQLPLFEQMDVVVRHVFGADLGRQELYVTVPRRNAAAIRKFVSSESVRIAASESHFNTHLVDAGELQGVKPVWQAGVTGAGGTILWVDTGGDTTQEDFAGRLDLVDMVGEGPEDWHGHGTHVAGISIADNEPFIGMARGARGIMAKVFSRETPGASDGDIMGSAVVAKEKGVDVVSLSLGSRGSSADNLAEFFSQLTHQKLANGEYPIVTASAGNSGPFDRTLSQPAAGVEVLAVAAAAKSLDDGRPEISFFSSVGPDVDRRFALRRLRLKPEITGIGGDVTTEPGSSNVYKHGVQSSKSKDAARSPADLEDGKHTALSGTSMSNPMLAGIALLVKLAIKTTGGMTPFVAENLPFAVKAVLMRSAKDLGAPVWFQGAGLVDAWAAVSLVASAAGKRLGSGLKGLWARVTGEPVPPAEGWAWLERLKALKDLEDGVFRSAELAKTEAQARLDDSSGAEDADMPSEDRAAINNAAQAEAQRRFNGSRDEALPKVLEALKDPVWLVRFQAAFVLMNLRTAAAALPLAEAALNDADPRVRRMAFLAIAETPTHSVDVLLQKAAEREAWDVGAYAAYALARRGDRSAVPRAVKELASADKSARFTAAWLLGQLSTQATKTEAEALSGRVKDGAERGNIRHLSAASLGNLASAVPEAISDQVIVDLLEAAGPDNIALTRTIQKFFPIALRDKTLVARLRQEPLKAIVTGFVTRNKDAILKPGALSELVQQLARVVNIPLGAPTSLADPTGAGVAGVDAAIGPVDLLVAPAPGGALDDAFLARFEATVRADLPLSGLKWVSVPEHKLYAFSLALQHRGFGMRASAPLYPLTNAGEARAGTVLELGDGEAMETLPEGADLSLVKVRASAGISEARVMAALEAVAARAAGKGPTVVSLALTAPSRRRMALTRLVDRLVASGLGVVVPAGDAGPRAGTLAAPGDSALAVVAAAASSAKEPAFYSGRGTAEAPRISWADLVDELLPGATPGEGQVLGTGAAAERTAEKLAALAKTLADGLAAKGQALPSGWFQLVTAHAARHLVPMPASRPHEVGGGLFADLGAARAALEKRLEDPAGLAREAAAHAERLKAATAAPTAAEPEPGFWRGILGAARGFVPGVAAAEKAAKTAAVDLSAPSDGPRPESAGFAARRALLKVYKRALMDGGDAADGRRVGAFRFSTAAGWFAARSAGLEGFVYSKRELAAQGLSTRAQLDDQFTYLDALLSAAPELASWRDRFSTLRTQTIPMDRKEAAFDALTVEAMDAMREKVGFFDASLWGRRNATYMVFARAYNRLKPGKNFFDSLDEAELLRIKNDPAIRANEVWLMDVFEIGEVNRWGTGGGSSYSIKGYILKKELGGEEAFKAFVARAHKAGLKVKLDFIPNHTSLDSEMIRRRPEGFLHVVPPQELSDEEIMAAVPRERNGNRSPIYRLVRTESYPMPDGSRKPMRILVHHPRTDYGDVMWVDLAQIDYSQPAAREWQIAQMKRLFEDLGVDSARRDMAYEILNARYPSRWNAILEDELRDIPAGWMRDAHERMLVGFKSRWHALHDEEFFDVATDKVKEGVETAVMIDEAYSHADELSRSGSDGVYNKNDHDGSRSQVGLYDAMQSRSGSRIRAALRHAAFRRWQLGGAAMVNFVGTHDGGEGNPVDKFGPLFKSAVLTAMLLRPILYYNGLEQGVGQRENLIGDLSRSVDTAKAIPYDIPVLIDWTKTNEENRAYLAKVLAVGEEDAATFDRGVMEVLEPNYDAPMAAWTVSDAHKTFLMAANWSNDYVSAQFRFDKAVLKGLGAFVPEAGKRYRFADRLNPRLFFEREGRELLERGLYIGLTKGETTLLEVSDVAPVGPLKTLTAPNDGPRPGEGLPAPPSKPTFAQKWDRWTQRLTDSAAVAFLALQAPQIWANITNLLSGHPEQLANLPWLGYSTGILGNMLLLSWFASQKETSAARVQGIGVATSAVVVVQIFLAGFMPGAAFALIMPVIVGGLLLNWLKFKDKAPARAWTFWNRALALVGLAVLPQALWSTFVPAAYFSFLPGVLTALAGAFVMFLDSTDRLPAPAKKVWSNISGWTATLLFMYGPIAQLMSNLSNPAGMAGIAIGTLLLAMAGNLLMLPRAIHTKNLIWFTGSAWGVVMGGWAVMLTMFLAGFLAPALFWAATAAVPAWLGASWLLSRLSRR